MMSMWWILWMGFIFMFLLAPLGYGWGYRSWGPPYPRYIQRRRHAAALSRGTPFNHLAWGTGGDLMWVVMLVAFFALLSLFWGH